MTQTKRFSLVKPTTTTPFRIDFDWWKEHDSNWRVFLQSYLCSEHQETFANPNENTNIDWVDPQSAEVKQVDGLQHVLMSHCALQEGFVTANTSLVDSVFRVFLAHGNEPMTPTQLSAETNRPAETILRLFSGPQVYKGIRPKHD